MANDKQLSHLGIILDGNRRWAKKQGVPTIEGHRQGFRALKGLLKTIQELQIDYLSVYVFSTENWNRTKEEVDGLMGLFRWIFKQEIEDIIKENIRIQWVGSPENVPEDIAQLLKEAEERTKDLDGGVLAICLNYGGHKELVDCFKAIQAEGAEITEESITKHLYQPDIPPLDLLIRSSGEQRISNFMLWRAAYTELAFTDTLWPDFSPDELRAIVDEYHGRSRRYGA